MLITFSENGDDSSCSLTSRHHCIRFLLVECILCKIRQQNTLRHVIRSSGPELSRTKPHRLIQCCSSPQCTAKNMAAGSAMTNPAANAPSSGVCTWASSPFTSLPPADH